MRSRQACLPLMLCAMVLVLAGHPGACCGWWYVLHAANSSQLQDHANQAALLLLRQTTNKQLACMQHQQADLAVSHRGLLQLRHCRGHIHANSFSIAAG